MPDTSSLALLEPDSSPVIPVGGGGLAAALRLQASCADVTTVLAEPARAYEGIAAHQLHILRRLGATLPEPDALPDGEAPDLSIDALVGYRLDGPLRGYTVTLINWANRSPAPVLSLDLPSGLCATSGDVWEPCVRATATVTLALSKTGLWKNGAHAVTGELHLADIGVPDVAFAAVGVEPGPIFAKDELLRIGRSTTDEHPARRLACPGPRGRRDRSERFRVTGAGRHQCDKQ